MFISDSGCLLRKVESGENHLLLALFLQEQGLLYALGRRSSKTSPGAAIPDLFSTGHFVLRRKTSDRPAFLQEFILDRDFRGIGQNYPCLMAASSLAAFYEKNLLHLEHYAAAWDLLLKALASLCVQPAFPESTLLKTYFSFARAEGYPVIAQWLNQKPKGERQAIASVLKTPTGEQRLPATELLRWIEDLLQYLARETDLLPPVT